MASINPLARMICLRTQASRHILYWTQTVRYATPIFFTRLKSHHKHSFGRITKTSYTLIL
jgi:hypothetical protein